MRTILILASALSVSVAVLAGCGGGGEKSDPGFEAVATTPLVSDLLTNVAGDTVSVVALLPANADPHDFEPSPSDAEALVGADLIVRSGGDLDVWLDQLVDGSGTDAPVLELIDSMATIEGGHDHGEDDADAHEEPDSAEDPDHTHEGEDPHWWQSPVNAIAAIEAIRDELVALDPGSSATFARNADRYIGELEELDAAIESCVGELPEGDRKLVTSHDALGYFAERYGFEVVGAAIPALTTRAQASAGETAELVELIRAQDVAAIFPEAGVSAGLEQAIAAEAGAEIGPELHVDTLGPPDSDAGTYMGAMATNTLSIVDALSRGEADCSELRAPSSAGR